jgi:hypothetical protein
MKVRWAMKAVPVEVPGLPPLPQKQKRGKDGAPKVRGLGASIATGVAALLIAVCAAVPAEAKDAPRSFSLSTSRTFAPGESVKIQLFARNVPALEFRVYKVKDAEKFFAGLKDLHSFGVKSRVARRSRSTSGRGWSGCTTSRRTCGGGSGTFSAGSSLTRRGTASARAGQAGQTQPVVGGVSEFAQVPLLNESQLVARWKLVTPPALVSETQQLPIDGLARAFT